MPTCTRGTVAKTVSGTITVRVFGVKITTFALTNERAEDSWNTCTCPEGFVVREGHCITADANQSGEVVRGSDSPANGITIDYDLTVDTARRITNCEYECVTREEY